MASTVDKSDFTKGSIPNNIIRMAIPLTIALLVNALYSIVDRIYLGHIPGAGAFALTGVGLAFPIITIVTSFQNLFGNGGAPVFAMASGKGDKKLASKYMNTAAIMLLVMGVALTIIGFLVKEDVLWMIGASNDTFDYANEYLDVYLLGTVFVMISLGLNPYINAQGHPKVGMATVLIGAVINIILDPVFIFVLNMGVKGAAIATIISQFFSAIWVLFFLFKQAPLKLDFSGFKLELPILKKIIGLGLIDFCFAVTNSAVSMICNARLQFLGGDSWVASMTVISSLREVLLTVNHGLTGGASPSISYNYGANRYDRVKGTRRWLFGIMMCYFLMVWALTMFAPGMLAGLFCSDPVVYECCKVAIRLFFCLQFFMVFQSVGQTTFKSLGMSKYGLFFSLFRKVILVIPLVYLLPNIAGLGVYGVFLSEPTSDIVGGLSCYFTMRNVTKRKFAREASIES